MLSARHNARIEIRPYPALAIGSRHAAAPKRSLEGGRRGRKYFGRRRCYWMIVDLLISSSEGRYLFVVPVLPREPSSLNLGWWRRRQAACLAGAPTWFSSPWGFHKLSPRYRYFVKRRWARIPPVPECPHPPPYSSAKDPVFPFNPLTRTTPPCYHLRSPILTASRPFPPSPYQASGAAPPLLPRPILDLAQEKPRSFSSPSGHEFETRKRFRRD